MWRQGLFRMSFGLTLSSCRCSLSLRIKHLIVNIPSGRCIVVNPGAFLTVPSMALKPSEWWNHTLRPGASEGLRTQLGTQIFPVGVELLKKLDPYLGVQMGAESVENLSSIVGAEPLSPTLLRLDFFIQVSLHIFKAFCSCLKTPAALSPRGKGG